MKKYGLLKSSLDAHTLGINAIYGQLKECKQWVVLGTHEIEKALREIKEPSKQTILIEW